MPDDDEKCPTCEVNAFPNEDGIVPVWENPEDYNRGAPPDYLGCTKCHTMRPYEPEPATTDDDVVAEAVEYISDVVDTGSASRVPLKPGETLNQCSTCGCRIISPADEDPPKHCKCDHDDPDREREWIAVREKSSDPDPMAEAIVDVAERWPIDSDAARLFLADVGYTPPRRPDR